MNELVLNRLKNRQRDGVLFSVIIPAHNAEATLRRAVESVITAMGTVQEDAVVRVRMQRTDLQGPEGGSLKLQEEDSGSALFEVLIIENTSEDATWQLANTLQEEHPGIVRAFQCEPGVSNGRNRGLEEACGEWILFLDADDYFLESAGEVLCGAVHFTGTDLILCSFEAGEKTVHVCREGGERFSGKELMGISVRIIEDPTRYTSVWGKFFRRSCIERLHLRFDPALRLSEDSHFLIRCLAGCRRIRLLDRPFYHYSTDTASAVRTFDGSKEEGYRRSLEAVQKYLRTQPEEIRAAGAAYGMMQFNILMVREVFSAGNPMSLREKIRRMREISEEEPFAAAIGAYDPGRHKGARFLPIRLLRRKLFAGAAAVYEARVIQNGRREKRSRPEP